ncbi:DUF4168 domain-containing protein (plasmid) [Nitratireductor sp. GISD-1A_MAKvit]|uniref:DUF4168 domain-containing protein n=1 Tax=Nitratireductor sp. GISD-1A_MAKvit TaxID=3234198 RepID=UPI003467A747
MILRSRLRMVAAAFVFTAGATTLAPALAQDAVPTPAPNRQAQSFDEKKLEAFTVAFLAVSDVKQQYSERFRQAPGETEKQQVQSEATKKMEQAVDQTDGISVDEYNEIIQTAQTDETLAKKLNGMIGEAAKSQQ